MFRDTKVPLSKNTLYGFIVNGSIEGKVTVIEYRLACITIVTSFRVTWKATVKGL